MLTLLAAILLQQAAPVAAQAPITPGTIAVKPPVPADPRRPSPYVPFTEALRDALTDAGFTAIPGVDNARYVVTYEVTRTGHGAVRTDGSGGGGLSGAAGGLGAAMGGAVALALGSGRNTAVGELVATELSVSVTRRGETAPAWTGRVVTHQVAGTREDEPARVAGKLAAALFRNFPQESGLSVSIP